eukprot:CAMPEP_0173239624 /NCGR_PEP_ID=MMETSP1142-20121109/13316_1 /TAXON_ID=483371 /ORGANISM="non described non described, Strain CCMP2298" /LENGTH=323 /DNA_ID=CAMNT_0014170659 /DNA_START=125 /DNA_END=1094 /DNA_ORIENTATION=+
MLEGILDPDEAPQVDFAPIAAADRVLEDCQFFVDQASSVKFDLFPLLTLMSSGVKTWNAKRRDARLATLYTQLHPRITASEAQLRSIIAQVVEKKMDVRVQAQKLQQRLKACVLFNKTQLGQSEAPVEALRGLISTLSSESALLKQMIEFNKELLCFKASEKISKGQGYVRWGGLAARTPGRRAHTWQEGSGRGGIGDDDAHPEMEGRLVQLRKLREQFVAALGSVLELRGAQLSHLDNCEHALRIASDIASRSGVTAQQLDLQNVPDSPGATEEGTWDHAQCGDCSYGYARTGDCTMHLGALHLQSLQANDRLQQLVQLRER